MTDKVVVVAICNVTIMSHLKVMKATGEEKENQKLNHHTEVVEVLVSNVPIDISLVGIEEEIEVVIDVEVTVVDNNMVIDNNQEATGRVVADMAIDVEDMVIAVVDMVKDVAVVMVKDVMVVAVDMEDVRKMEKEDNMVGITVSKEKIEARVKMLGQDLLSLQEKHLHQQLKRQEHLSLPKDQSFSFNHEPYQLRKLPPQFLHRPFSVLRSL